ncbi:MAG: ATP synthase subunit I [Rhizomicrobium sp.]
MIAVASMITAFGFAGFGALSGYLHLMLLSLGVRALVGRARGVLPMLIPLARIAATTAALAFAARQGAMPLLAALAGFLIVRALLVRRPEILIP